jgi:pimeloyl-ACP methyl ester carboxylesterase
MHAGQDTAPDASSIRSEAVVLLHGLWMNRFAMHYLVRALARQGFQASALGYRSMLETLEGHVELLTRRVAETHGDAVHLVGHSMGGRLVLRYLQKNADPRVRRAVLLATPVTGCRAATMMGGRALGRMLLGRSVSLWREPFDARVDPRYELGVIAGDRPFGLGGMLLRMPAPSDGVVRVEETRFPGVRAHLCLPVGHSAMLVSARVARQVGAFLKRGEFLQ